MCAQDEDCDKDTKVGVINGGSTALEKETEKGPALSGGVSQSVDETPTQCLPNLNIIDFTQKWRLFWTTTILTFRCPCQCLDLGAYWDGFQWDMIPEEDQKRWEALGWDEDSWDDGENIPDTATKEWKDLTDEQKSAATALGYNEKSWNADE